MSEGSWYPKTWREAVPLAVWGVLVFACGFEFVSSATHAELWPSIYSGVGFVVLLAMLIHGRSFVERLKALDIGWMIGTGLVLLALSIISQQQGQSIGPSAGEIARAVAEKLKPSLPIAQPQVQSFGFATTESKIPSKNYSNDEKQALLGLIGTVSALLNDEGLPAAQMARVTGYNAVTPSKDGLDDAMKRAESVRDSLVKIQLKIWQDILQPKNSNYLVDLNYIVDNYTKVDQFQRATEQFLGTVTNFQTYLNSFNPDQRNWITSLIQTGIGQNWGRTAEEFRGYVEQCNTRMNTEREALK